ncbi:CD83 antigen-like isoform X2 [Chiloscyllium plagiosum]|uniref:CD83 antigen-like isoform X2 n=1 Tax=Chiloscyllium plagiosum TaxID=36176 RepID=UPI001CB7F7B1|nr:CD83 antigen-like isoform X2 [Chiloscyllium plagiosum]
MRWREAELIHQWLVVFLLYLRPVGTGELPSVAARCTQTATLPCTARRQVMQSYRAVSWYKVGEATLSGIIRKAGNEMIRYKHFNGNAMITENDSLVIARVTEDDAGIYRCSLLAPLGGMNQDGDVTLSVCLPLDPVTEPAVTSLRRTATASLLHSRSGACICVPVILSFITCLSFVAVITMVFRKMRRPNQENPEAGGKVEEHLVQSLREHIQRVSLEKDQRSVRVRSQLDGSVHCVWAVGHV